MKRLTQKLASLALVAAVLSLTSGAAHAGSFVPRVAGTWEIVGIPDAGGCGPKTPFINVSTITFGGQITNVDPVLGTTVGSVYKLGRKTYAVGFFGFIPAEPGVFAKLEVQATLKLINLGEAVGKFRTIVSDFDGNPQCVYEGTIQGTRLVAVPY